VGELAFCPRCARNVQRIVPPICRCCGLPVAAAGSADILCGDCLSEPPAFGRARAAFVYAHNDEGSPIARALARFKYGRIVSLAGPLGSLLRYAGPLDAFAYDWLTPVPLSLERLRWRGFNQSLLLAHALNTGTVAPALLERSRPTRAQAELRKKDRRGNVRGAFRVRAGAESLVRGARILLVDDVLTTGSTANECALALRRAGARVVDVLALARVTLL